jgi:thiol:disulfide interchange protein DsbC
MKNRTAALLASAGLLVSLQTGTVAAQNKPATAAPRAETAQESAVRKLIQPKLGGDAPIDRVSRTPYAGLYEVQVGNDIIYTDDKAHYLFVGRVLDTTTFEDYTRSRIEEVSRVKFSELPLDLAMKTVKGNGQRTIAVFEDPNCGYCKRFRKTLQGIDNITVYTFMYNILSPDSEVKSRNIWCSADPNKTWNDWMLENKTPPAAPASCKAPHDKVLALGQRLKITGTPTIFFTDGTRVPGALDAKALESKLASVK